jgi:hypothetical protein
MMLTQLDYDFKGHGRMVNDDGCSFRCVSD